jgi:hypothetical protein
MNVTLLVACLLSLAGVAAAQPAADTTPPATARAGRAMPVIHILYSEPDGSTFDGIVPTLMRESPDSVWAAEAVRRLPEFQAAWEREGPAYLQNAFQLVRLEFPYHEVQVALTVSSVHSMSQPLLINVRRYLAAAQPTTVRPVGLGEFCEEVFHQLMNHYVRPVYGKSELLKKYASDSPVVRSQLHVMALEVLVLTRLGKSAELAYIDREYKTNSPPGYARAWQIVRAEGAEAFVTELAHLR